MRAEAAAQGTPAEEGRAALAALDRALARKPERDGHAFSDMTEHLCVMRGLLIHGCRHQGHSRETLGRLNSVISTALAGHFPLGSTPWSEVEQARGVLEALIADVQGRAPP